MSDNTSSNSRTDGTSDAKRQIMAGMIVASGDFDRYTTTTHSCTCKDRQYRGATCKHMRALRMMNAGQAALAAGVELAAGGRAAATSAPAVVACDCLVFLLRGECQHVEDAGL